MSLEVKKAINNVREMVGKLAKNKSNDYHGSRYADLPSVLDAIREPMAEAGLFYCQFTSFFGDHFGLYTEIIHEKSGEHISNFHPIPIDQNPQKVGSAETYARRYSLCTILGLSVIDDDAKEWPTKPKQNARKSQPKQQSQIDKRDGIPRHEFAKMVSKIPGCKNIDEVNKLRKEYAKHIQVASKEQLDGFRQAFDAKKKALAES